MQSLPSHEPEFSGSSQPASSGTLSWDERLSMATTLVDGLLDDVLNAPVGALGAPEAGLEGDAAANVTRMLELETKVQLLSTVYGTRVSESGKLWQGLSALLRSSGKLSEADIRARVRAGQVTEAYPTLTPKWADGSVSMAQVRIIGDLARKIPVEDRDAAVEFLADHAPLLNAKELAHAGRVLLNAVAPGWEDRACERREEQAFVSLFEEADGYLLRGQLTVEQGGWLQTVLDSLTSVVASDDTRSKAQRQAEALTTVMRKFAASEEIPQLNMARPRFVVMATLNDLRAIAGDAAPGDLPQTAFNTWLAPATTRRMLSDAEVVPIVVGDDVPSADPSETDEREAAKTLAEVALDAATAKRLHLSAKLLLKRRKSREFAKRCAPPVFLRLLLSPVEPLAHGRESRVVPTRLRNAVLLRDQQCVVDGCTMPAHRCEIHHVQPWALGGSTDIDNLATLCLRHHRTVENGTWRLRRRTHADGPGKYWISERW